MATTFTGNLGRRGEAIVVSKFSGAYEEEKITCMHGHNIHWQFGEERGGYCGKQIFRGV